MFYRSTVNVALALAMGAMAPAWAADYRFAADVYIDANTVRRFEASVAPQQSKMIEVGSGFVLKFAVGQVSASGAATLTSLSQIRAGMPVELALIEHTGPSSHLRESTLSTCMAMAIGGRWPHAVNGTLALPGGRFHICPEGSVDALERQRAPLRASMKF